MAGNVPSASSAEVKEKSALRRKKVAILCMNEKGNLAELSRDYGVSSQSVQYYMKLYKKVPPERSVQSAVCETHRLWLEEKAKGAAEAAAEKPSSSKDAAEGLKPTPERRVDAFRKVRTRACASRGWRRSRWSATRRPGISLGSTRLLAALFGNSGRRMPRRRRGRLALRRESRRRTTCASGGQVGRGGEVQAQGRRGEKGQ